METKSMDLYDINNISTVGDKIIFNCTVKDNIFYTNKDITNKDIIITIFKSQIKGNIVTTKSERGNTSATKINLEIECLEHETEEKDKVFVMYTEEFDIVNKNSNKGE